MLVSLKNLEKNVNPPKLLPLFSGLWQGCQRPEKRLDDNLVVRQDNKDD